MSEDRKEERFESEHKPEHRERLADHVVFIGNKPFMNYVTGVVMQFTTQGADEVVVKARGRFASRAIDVVEVARKRLLEGQGKDGCGSLRFWLWPPLVAIACYQ